MTFDPVLNFAKVNVSTGYNATDTTIVLSSGGGAELPDPAVSGAFNLVWWSATDYADPANDPSREIVRVTARTGDTLTVTRNQESSGAFAHNTNFKTYQMVLSFTKKLYDDFSNQINNLVTITNSDSPYTSLTSDKTIICNCTAGAITVNLPAASTVSKRIYEIKKIDSTNNAVTVDGNGAETIDDSTTAILTSQYDSITIQSDGTEWWII